MSDYPALPDAVEAPAGPVRVVLGINLTTDAGRPADGHYEQSKRLVTVDSSLTERQRWYTFYHEMTHVALMDSGVANLLGHRKHEAICDALATARLRERFG